MSLRASWITTLFLPLAWSLVASSAAESGTIDLSKPNGFAFPLASLVVANLDGQPALDLAGIHDTNVLVELNNGSGSFSTTRTFPMGTFSLVAFATADLDGDGRRDLVAITSQPALATRLNAPGMIFGNVVIDTLPSRGAGLALGDLNGDGAPDAVTTLPDSGEIAICLNDGAGAFGPPLVIRVGSTFTEPVIGDFNGDGHPDVVVATYAPNQAILLIAGHGDGTFDPPAPAVFTDEYRHALVAADFDGDGKLDLGAVGDDDVAIHWNLGNGTFAPAQVLSPGFQEFFQPSAHRIAAGDLDRDGRLDLVVGGCGPIGFDHGNNYLAVFPNRGGRAFGHARQYRVGVNPKDVAVADLDGDGWLDGVATCAGLNEQGIVGQPNQVAATFVLKSAGAAGLTSMLEVYEPVWLPARPAADSVPDLYGGHDGTFYRAHNLGHGIFADAESIGTGDPLVARDLDGDGDEDLLIAHGDTLAARLNLGAPGLGPERPIGSGLHFEDFGDANGDHHPDLFATDATHRVRIFTGDGSGGFAPPLDTGVDAPVDGAGEWPAAARDVNGDGLADLEFAVALPTEDTGSGDQRFVHRLDFIVRLGNGNGSFAAPETTQAVYRDQFVHDGGGGPIVFGDWNGDGLVDVACGAASCLSGNPSWFPAFVSTGSGTFAPFASLDGGASMCDLAAADLNGDRRDDLVRIDSPVGNTYSATPLASDGLGGFSGVAYQMGDFPVLLSVADFDGDGRKDVLTRNDKIPDYTRFSYSIRRNVTTQATPTSVAVALVVSTFSAGAVHLDWYAGAPGRFAGAIEKRTSGADWKSLGTRVSDDDGHLRYTDTDVVAGRSYAYRLDLAPATGGATIATSWILVPVSELTLSGVWPNPVAGRPALVFSTPSRGDVEMKLIDVAGRVVADERFPNLDPGSHRLAFRGPTPPPGYYVAQVEHAGRRLQTPVVVLR